jgi:hypothetical protein
MGERESEDAQSYGITETPKDEFPNCLKPIVGRAFFQTLAVVEWAVSSRLRIPALTLLYSVVDVAAGLSNREMQQRAGRHAFIKWVDKYVVPDSTLGCTALDLYAARCGLVHGFSATSDLSAAGKARRIVYAWAPSQVGKLRELSRIAGPQYVAIQGDDFCARTREAVAEFSSRRGAAPYVVKARDQKGITNFRDDGRV